MSTDMVRKIAGERSRHSVVELNDVCHVFVTVVPRVGGTLRDQTRDALEGIAAVMRAEGATGAVIHQAVFLADYASIPACRQIVRGFYGRDVPATSYIAQPPCEGRSRLNPWEGKRVAIEAMGLGRGRDKVAIQRISDQVVVTRQNGVAWVYADHAVPRTSAGGVYEKTICTYQHLRRLLPDAGVRLDQVVRTWLYLGDIVDDDGPIQRYKELNRARADFYQHVPFLADRLPEGYNGPAFPASTGIGTTGRSMSLSALAVVSDNDNVVAVPLENPRQTAAYKYSTSYSPTSPKFSRGLALCQGEDATLFISGTASITNSETRHDEDIVAQTHETLDNISALIAEENLSRHGLPGRGTTLEGLGVVRVYVKRPRVWSLVRAACEQRLGAVPATYVMADVCRPDLLVEIEGIAFSRKAPDASSARPLRRCAARTEVCSGCGKDGDRAPYCPETCPERLLCPNAVLRASPRGGSL
jgi:enamine deaminase RidA (YjgF/YER057c/UK114 family)